MDKVTINEPMSYGAALAFWAERDADQPMLTDGKGTLSRSDFDKATNRAARLLESKGVVEGDIVTIALPNEADLLIYFFATWKLGAAPQTLSPRMSQKEFQEIVEVGKPRVVIGVDEGFVTGTQILPYGTSYNEFSDAPLPDKVAMISRAPVSGGSTGRPKVILIKSPAAISQTAGDTFRIEAEETHVVPGRLYHGAPLIITVIAMGLGCHVVLMEKFDAEDTLRQIDNHKADYAYLVPTMMQRMFKLPDDVKAAYDISSLRTMFHTSAPCPAWLKEEWVNWVAKPEVVFELYGMTEGLGGTCIDGAEWLAHKGSVGRALAWCEIQIVDDDGVPVAAGETGEVYMRPIGFEPPYEYVEGNDKRRRLDGGWESGGDMGHLDQDGYLYLGDRRNDMILVGGANVYPAEIEAAIDAHPAVRSSAVIGLPHEDMGNQVHAIVDAPDGVDEAALIDHLKAQLTPYKLPRSFEFVGEPLRGDDGKVRRSKLREARL